MRRYQARLLVVRTAGAKPACVMVGAAGDTAAASFASAEETMRTFYLSPEGPNYPAGHVIVDEVCQTCRGSGRTWTGKRIRREHVCKSCKGVGDWPVLESRMANEGSAEVAQ